MNKRLRGILLVMMGVVMVLAALGMHVLHERQDALAGKNAEILLRELTSEIKFNESFLEFPDDNVPSQPVPESDPPSSTEDPIPSQPPESTPAEPMPSYTLSGYDLIGILRVPSVGVELPVLGEWSYSLLNVAPCRYSGSMEEENLIILGHNYKSHLQPLERVAVGDAVEFTDVHGVIYRYQVAEVENIHESDPERLATDHPLIIFTCTRDGQYRIVVRCDKVD